MSEKEWITVNIPPSMTYTRETRGNTRQEWEIREARIFYYDGNPEPGIWEFWEFDWEGRTYFVSKENDDVFEDEGRLKISGKRSEVVLKAFKTAQITGVIPEGVKQEK